MEEKTNLGRKSIFPLEQEDQQISASSCHTADDVHAVQERWTVLDDTVGVSWNVH